MSVCLHGWYVPYTIHTGNEAGSGVAPLMPPSPLGPPRSLLDADQEIPWADQPLVGHLKYRFWVQPYNASYHTGLSRRPNWGLGSPIEVGRVRGASCEGQHRTETASLGAAPLC
jgi:hypothetical protein